MTWIVSVFTNNATSSPGSSCVLAVCDRDLKDGVRSAVVLWILFFEDVQSKVGLNYDDVLV